MMIAIYTLRIDLVNGTEFFCTIAKNDEQIILKKLENLKEIGFPFLSIQTLNNRYVFINISEIVNILFLVDYSLESGVDYRDNFNLVEDYGEALPEIIVRIKNREELIMTDGVNQDDKLFWLNDELPDFGANPYPGFLLLLDEDEERNLISIDNIEVIELCESQIFPNLIS
jgi:hypothetical protein